MAPFYNRGVSQGYEVKLNDSTIYELEQDKPAVIRIYRKGDYVLSALTGKLTQLNLKLEKGRDYYIRCGEYEGSFLEKPKLQMVIEDFGRNEYEACVERFEKEKSKK